MSMVSCQKGPTRHAYAWQIGPFWQDTLDVFPTKKPEMQKVCLWYTMMGLWFEAVKAVILTAIYAPMTTPIQYMY